MGFEPHEVESQLETVNEFWDQMNLTLLEAKSTLAKGKDDMAQYYNQHQTLVPEYQVGDKVYLDASNICTTCPPLPWRLHDSEESRMECILALPSDIHVPPPPCF